MRDGTPIAAASVVLETMPSLDNAAAVPAGAPVGFRTVAQAQTDSAGRFALAPTGVLASEITNLGFVNFVATVSDGIRELQWSFPLAFADLAQGRRPAGLTAFRFDLGSHPGAADLKNPPSSWEGATGDGLTPDGLSPVPTEAVAGTTAGPTPDIYCTWYWTNAWQYGVREAFANVWGWTGALSTFHEATTTSHTLGIAFKSTSGLWSQSGSASLTETSSSEANSNGLWDNQVNNQVNYRQMAYTCGPVLKWVPVSTYALQSVILGWPHSAHPIWSACATYGSGQSYTKSQATNATFSAGVGLAEISVSAQAGWSVNVKNTWNFTANSWLCGSTAQGPDASPEVEAHQR